MAVILGIRHHRFCVELRRLCPAIRERQGASLMALTLRLTLRSYGRQTVVLREISTHPRSGERSYVLSQ